MGEVYATCGHKLPDGELGEIRAILTYSKEGERAVDWNTYCQACAAQYASDFADDALVKAWLGGD